MTKTLAQARLDANKIRRYRLVPAAGQVMFGREVVGTAWQAADGQFHTRIGSNMGSGETMQQSFRRAIARDVATR